MNIYDVLQTKPHSERYLARYVKFIQSRRPSSGPTEKHHICPKAKDLFPEYSSFKDHPWNRIDLTPREHYIAHLLLWKAFGGSQSLAISRFRNGKKTRVSSRCYDISQREARIWLSTSQKNRIFSFEHCRKISQAKLGHAHSEETKKKMSLAQRGVPKSEEAKKNMTASRIGKKRGPYKTKVVFLDDNL